MLERLADKVNPDNLCKFHQIIYLLHLMNYNHHLDNRREFMEGVDRVDFLVPAEIIIL